MGMLHFNGCQSNAVRLKPSHFKYMFQTKHWIHVHARMKKQISHLVKSLYILEYFMQYKRAIWDQIREKIVPKRQIGQTTILACHTYRHWRWCMLISDNKLQYGYVCGNLEAPTLFLIVKYSSAYLGHKALQTPELTYTHNSFWSKTKSKHNFHLFTRINSTGHLKLNENNPL